MGSAVANPGARALLNPRDLPDHRMNDKTKAIIGGAVGGSVGAVALGAGLLGGLLGGMKTTPTTITTAAVLEMSSLTTFTTTLHLEELSGQSGAEAASNSISGMSHANFTNATSTETGDRRFGVAWWGLLAALLFCCCTGLLFLGHKLAARRRASKKKRSLDVEQSPSEAGSPMSSTEILGEQKAASAMPAMPFQLPSFSGKDGARQCTVPRRNPQDLFGMMDSNHDGVLSPSEFNEARFNEARWAMQAPMASPAAVHVPAPAPAPAVRLSVPSYTPAGDVFSMMDRNHDGVLTRSEFNEAQFRAAQAAHMARAPQGLVPLQLPQWR